MDSKNHDAMARKLRGQRFFKYANKTLVSSPWFANQVSQLSA
jgi:hypothetical protein